MARRVFYSFHYDVDNNRAAQVRNMGFIEGNAPASANEWEAVKRGGDAAIQRWIDTQLDGKSCTIVLIGSQTAGRKWINYEIEKSWADGKGLLGIYIHRLKNLQGLQAGQGSNPFSTFNLRGTPLSSIVHAHNPPFVDSKRVYSYIAQNLKQWIEDACMIRSRY